MEIKETVIQSPAEARQEGIRQGKILATTKSISMLMKNLHIPVEDALVLLEIPKKERNTYRKTFAKRIPKTKKSPLPDAGDK